MVCTWVGGQARGGEGSMLQSASRSCVDAINSHSRTGVRWAKWCRASPSIASSGRRCSRGGPWRLCYESPPIDKPTKKPQCSGSSSACNGSSPDTASQAVLPQLLASPKRTPSAHQRMQQGGQPVIQRRLVLEQPGADALNVEALPALCGSGETEWQA